MAIRTKKKGEAVNTASPEFGKTRVMVPLCPNCGSAFMHYTDAERKYMKCSHGTKRRGKWVDVVCWEGRRKKCQLREEFISS